MRRFYTKGHEDQPRDDRGRWSSGGGSPAEDARVASAVRETVRTTTPEEDAHYVAAGGFRVPLPPHLAAARAERWRQQDAETARQERVAIANEHAMRAAGHLGEVPHAALDHYPAARQAAQHAVVATRSMLDAHHEVAAQALADLHAADHEEQLSATRDLVEHFADTSGQLGELAGDPNGPTFDHVSQHEQPGDLRQHADRAQTALEALHAQQIQAAGDLRSADKLHSRAARAVRAEADLEPADLVTGGDHRAEAAAESLLAHESRHREDVTSGMDFEDSHNALADETRATARAVKELSKVTGRAPRLAGKTSKAKRCRRRIYTVRKYDPDQPRDDHGRFGSGGGDHGGGPSMRERMSPGGDLHARGAAGLASPAFRAEHATRLASADAEARENFRGEEHSSHANEAAAAHTHGEAARIAAEHEAHGGEHGLVNAAEAARFDSQNRGEDLEAQHGHVMRAIAEERAARAAEDRAIAAGHVTTEARDIADRYESDHARLRQVAESHADKLEQAHNDAGAALAALHAHEHYGNEEHDSLEFEYTHDLVNHFQDTHNALSGSGLRERDLKEHEVDHDVPQMPDEAVLHPDHPDHEFEHDHGTTEHARERVDQLAAHEEYEAQIAAHAASLQRHADHAQAALERLHAQQIDSHAALSGIRRESDKALSAAMRKLEAMDDDHHVNHEVFAHHARDEHDDISDPAAFEEHGRAYDASVSMLEHAQSRIESVGSHDFGDALDSLKDERKATAHAIRELSRHSGRAPRLPGKTKKAARKRRRRIYTPPDRGAGALMAGY